MRIPPKRLRFLFAGLALALATAGQAHADPIIGGSTLIDSAGFTQLESWLGQGDITLTKVFSHTMGDGQTSYNFHAAVDGLGATFTVIQLRATQGNQAQVIGGYNPQSWNSTNSYNITPTDAARTAFLFNLTNVAIQRQKLGTQPNGVFPEYQTYNGGFYGPTFGAGLDLYVNNTLSSGYGINRSYGNTSGGNNITGRPYGGFSNTLDFGTIEVFTIMPASVAPEPSTLAAALMATVLGLTLHRHRRNQTA